MTADFLAVEPLIKDRLRERVSGLAGLYGADDLQGAQEGAQRTPAAHIIYTGATPARTRSDGLSVQVEQTWTVIIAVRHIRDPSKARGSAGEIIQAVCEALQGWRPSADHSPMSMTRAAIRPDYGGGFAYFPTSFTTHVTIHAAQE